MAIEETYTLEQAEGEIADLRGQVDRLSEVIAGTLFIAGSSLVPADPVNGGAETWHSLGTITGATILFARYRLVASPANSVEVEIEISVMPGTAVGYTFSNTVPGAYQPPSDKHQGGALSGSVAANPNHALITSGGSAQIQGLPSSGYNGAFGVHFTYPLDS